MAEHHEHGTMNIEAHEKTFHGFVTFVKNAVLVIIAILIIMAVFGH